MNGDFITNSKSYSGTAMEQLQKVAILFIQNKPLYFNMNSMKLTTIELINKTGALPV